MSTPAKVEKLTKKEIRRLLQELLDSVAGERILPVILNFCIHNISPQMPDQTFLDLVKEMDLRLGQSEFKLKLADIALQVIEEMVCEDKEEEEEEGTDALSSGGKSKIK